MKKVLLDNGSVWLKEIPEPILRRETDVKIQVDYASICGYDLMVYRGQASPGSDFRVGHEVSGTVLETGAQVTGLEPGDKVAVRLDTACGQCAMCRAGKPDYCLNMQMYDGGMQERMVCPEQVLCPLGGLGLRAGCLIEPLTMGMCSVKKADIRGGERVLILGGGAMGLLMLKLLRLYPVSEVVIADPNQKKRKMARDFGATWTFDPASPRYMEEMNGYCESEGYDVVIEASGNPASAKLAFHLAARGGRVVFFGLYGMNFELPVNLFNLYYKDVSIHAVLPSTTLYPAAVKLAPRLRLEELITAEFPYWKASEAFQEKASGEHAKVVLKFHLGTG